MGKEVATTVAIHGKTQHAPNAVVGILTGSSPIYSNEYDIIRVEFNDDFHGVESSGRSNHQSILTFAKNLSGNDQDIVSPIVIIAAGYEYPIYSLISGVISRISEEKRERRGVVRTINNNISISIIIPGQTPSTVTEYSFLIPTDIRLNRKTIYIPKFDIYITGIGEEVLQELKEKRISCQPQRDTEVFIKIGVSGKAPDAPIYYIFNGISGSTRIDPNSKSFGLVSVQIKDEVFTQSIPNNELRLMSETKHFHWNNFGGIDLYLDTDRDRLLDYYNDMGVLRGVDKNSAEYIKEIRDDHEKAKEAIKNRDQIIRDLKAKITELKVALTEAENRSKQEQEEFKTKREEIRYHSTIADQRHAAVMDTIKLIGGVLGTISIIVTMVTKMKPTPPPAATTNKVVEWTVPMLSRKCSMMGGISALAAGNPVGLSILAAGAVAVFCWKIATYE